MKEKVRYTCKKKRENYKKSLKNFGANKVKIKRSKFQEIQKVEDTKNQTIKVVNSKRSKIKLPKEVKNSKRAP